MVVTALVFVPSLSTIVAARADVANASATNVQEGDNKGETAQGGSSKSGDAVAGQVAGVVSGGNTSVDATNKSDNVDVSTGDATADNSASEFVGLNASTTTLLAADVVNAGGATNVQEGDNKADLGQTATAVTGDGVGGEVIGVVTSAGGSASIVAANTSTDVDIETGDSDAFNSASAFVGLNASSETLVAADVLNLSTATNVQEGDNKLDADQKATSASGDGVGGQVLGVVSAGDASIDATNKSDDVDIETGDTTATNDFSAFVGLNATTATVLAAADVINAGAATNVQEGDNKKDITQNADASSGDSVAGQVAGVVTSAGGSADLVLANTSTDSDSDTGDSDFDNTDSSFTGLNASPFIFV